LEEERGLDFKDYYKSLDVPKDAPAAEIQKAYRKLARKLHPDINKAPEAETRFKEINEAYEVLKDPDKRAKYDRYGSAWKQAQQSGGPPPGFENVRFDFGDGGGFGGSGFSSFFEGLFGGAGGNPFGGGSAFGGAPRGGRRNRRKDGQNMESILRLTLSQAAHGGEHQVTVSDPLTGSLRNLTVTIPKGILPGKKIRLADQGGEGFGGAPRGDLFLKVELLPDANFSLEDNNLYTSLPLTPWEAVLGCTASVPTLDGSVTVRIPAGSSSGRKIRLRGRGFPARSGTGDLYAELKIVVPSEITPRDKELFEELAEVSQFQPREEAKSVSS